MAAHKNQTIKVWVHQILHRYNVNHSQSYKSHIKEYKTTHVPS